MHEFVFDFGALSRVNEANYTMAMVRATMVKASELDLKCSAAMMSAAQQHVRECEGDASAVSLRDVARCLKLVKFFVKTAGPRQGTVGGANKEGLSLPLTLAIAHVYFFRLGSTADRRQLWSKVRSAIRTCKSEHKSHTSDFYELIDEGKIEEVILLFYISLLQVFISLYIFFCMCVSQMVGGAKRRFCNKFELEPGIALNQALMENL